MPGIVIRCLEYSEFKDIGRPVAFLAKMISHRPLAVQLVGKGLLDANRMRRLLDTSNSREILLDILMIISDLARMDKVSIFIDFSCFTLHADILILASCYEYMDLVSLILSH